MPLFTAMPGSTQAWPFVGLLLVLVCALRSPAMGSPQVIRTLLPTEDVVVASRVIEAPHDGAADATAAIQAAIDGAAGEGGGVVFLPAGRYRLEGRLVLKEGVTIRGDWAAPPNPPKLGGGRGAATRGTILMPAADRGNAEAPPAITMERGTGIREVTLWYPDQTPTAPVPYPWTLRTSDANGGNNISVYNVTLVNAYQAIRIGPEWNELHTIRNVYGTPLKTGVWIDTCTDIGRLIDVHFSPRWWETSGLPGAPAGQEQKAALRAWLLREGTGVDMGRSDWEYLYNVNVEGYAVGLTVRPGVQGTTNAVLYGGEMRDCGTALRLERLNGVGLACTGARFSGREHAVCAPPSFDTVVQLNACTIGGPAPQAVLLEGSGLLTFQNCTFTDWGQAAVEARSGSISLLGCEFKQAGTHVNLGEDVQRARLLGNRFQGQPGVRSESKGDVQVAHGGIRFARPNVAPHVPAPHPRPKSRRLFVVTDFDASPGAADNTGAFARALDAAGKAGGGTVYVPAGNYRFAGEIVVPTGVELRGIFDVPHHTHSAGSVLMPTAGRGSADGTPFIRLEARSGLRGLTVWYPDQNLQSISPYPWTVQSQGPGCWLLDVTLGNAYQGVDFWTHPSDGHVIRYLAGGMLKRGVLISKCKGDGWVEDVQFNPHYTARLHAGLPQPKYEGDVFGALIETQRAQLEGIVFGRCEREHVRGTFLYAAFDGIAFRDDGGGANARVIEHGTDTGSRCAVLEAAGPKGLEFLNAQLVPLGNYEVGAIIATPSFAGKASFFNTQIWAGSFSGILEGKGEVLIQQMNTLSGGFMLAGGRSTLENVHFARDLTPHVRVAPECRAARLVANLSPDALRLVNAATVATKERRQPRLRRDRGERLYARANAASLPPPPGLLGFSTGWEPDEPEGLADTIATSGGGIRSVSGATCRPTEHRAPPYPPKVGGEGGARCLRVAGNADDPDYSYVYFRVFDLAAKPIALERDHTLSYWLRPENERGRRIGVDLLFADGSTLRDSGARTTDGVGTHPGEPKGKVGEWTQVTVAVGRYARRKRVAAILVAYDSRDGGGPFEALIDDLRLMPTEDDRPWQCTAEPAGGAIRVGQAVTLTPPPGLAVRYTLDGTEPASTSPRYEKPIVLSKPGLWEIRFRVEVSANRLSARVLGALYDVRK